MSKAKKHSSRGQETMRVSAIIKADASREVRLPTEVKGSAKKADKTSTSGKKSTSYVVKVPK